MIKITYKDAYQQVRSQEFPDLAAAQLAFSGCLTLPDYYPVLSLTKDSEDLGFTGSIGQVYHFLQSL
ncbi:TPA: DUF4649 family protein [Streptococcus suis]|uniref:DUF4649 family protein n=2 Tax=Streptococcus TaxID=1301 RepID=A0A4T2GR72_STRSU|nr:DUF4649 family protein [Streptococcus sp. 29896]MBL6538191.1 DUF4649 family protein [Streptococcus suis]MBM7269109.1 DUF4649 family protein [Streptococcus suis]MBM7314250.1 DUF4649 family protein [Streptococcus suis]MCK4027613.1 DUF4649 family protein [Streptococcus suis]TII01144.1 DUF4649 family protein [Streptococcus suis]